MGCTHSRHTNPSDTSSSLTSVAYRPPSSVRQRKLFRYPSVGVRGRRERERERAEMAGLEEWKRGVVVYEGT